MQKVLRTQNRVTIHLLQSKLKESGIECIIKNENPPLAGEIPAVVAPPELWILDDQQYANAVAIINYELANHFAAKPAWRCPQCNEMLEGQFDVCWNCGASKVP